MKNKNLERNLKALTALRGISGREDAVRNYIISEIGESADWHVDALGNLIVYKKGKQPAKKRLLFSAHMDEVGFIVTHIDEKGYLHFAPVGGVQPEVTGGRPVWVGDEPVYGVIGAKPVHLSSAEERKNPGKIEDFLIDIGAATREEAEEKVSVGDMVTFDSQYLPLGEERLAVRAIDDRAGCAMLLELIRSELPCDCIFAFTVQEEVGCFGAKPAAYAAHPEVAVVVESTTAGDLAGVPEEKKVCRVGGGPVVSFMDKGTVYDFDLYREVRAVATAAGIKNQTKEGVCGGNESRYVLTAREGCRTVAVSVPVRYLHSPYSVADTGDIEDTLALLSRLPAALAL